MKRLVAVLLIMVVLGSAGVSFAELGDKLANHWSGDMIDRDVLAYYFPYLAKDNFKDLDLNKEITKKDFSVSLASLYRDLGVEVEDIGIITSDGLKREDMLKIVGRRLEDFNLDKDQGRELPFKDINTMDDSSIKILRLLYNLELIYGISDREFGPGKELTQAEAIIILQRLKGVLRPMGELEFTTVGKMESYDSEESIIVRDLQDRVTVTITKSFPTPGYSLSIDKIKETSEGYKIFLDTKSPDEDSIQPQVITYKTVTVEIDKEELEKPAPYTFIVGAEDFPSGL